MSEYEFTLLLDGASELDDSELDAVYEAGCGDATISSRLGRVYLSFVRESDSMLNAILSAIGDVYSSGLKLTVARVDDCNLVNQADIARRIGRTRQIVNQYISGKRGRGGFPPPVCYIDDDHAPLWQWCEVSCWLCETGIISEDANRDIQELTAINRRLDWIKTQRREPNVSKTVADKLLELSNKH